MTANEVYFVPEMKKTSTTIYLPDTIRTKLAEDEDVESSVKKTLIAFGPWLQASGMPFFPGFTDHGVGHLSRVLETATWLIADEAWDTFSARDAGCLTVAVLLHDIAMHLTQDSFRALVKTPDQKPLIPALDTQTWPRLWLDFLLEARHWSGDKCEAVYGEEGSEKHKTVASKLVAGELDDLGESDCLFIGEWLRRHHPRLAHEISVSGVPRLDREKPLQIDMPQSFPALGDLAGLVARSHGMSLRQTFSYLNRKYHGLRFIQKTHPVFLMALIRIADYLDLHAERAPEGLLQVKVLRSVISRREWEAHHSITDIRYDSSDDPERIEVIAEPRSAQAYMHVCSWVIGIQHELDHSWAILGEVNGGREPYNRLGLRVRRISSPLENAEEFARQHDLPYVPQPARFTVLGGELLNLLIKPLYGDKPEVGIRELLQNAIDAVNELKVYRPESWKSNAFQMGADILVTICQREADWPPTDSLVPEDWHFWVEIADSGIGMTAATVRNYFLCAGASFRRSLEWSRTFKTETQSQVLRSGRFGIGVLASFLLGDEIQVLTRHIDEEGLGVGLKASLNQENIELSRVEWRVGTTVRVRIDKETASKFATGEADWRWFYLAEPKVVRVLRLGGKVQMFDDSYVLPGPLDPPGRWRPLAGTGFEAVMWNDSQAGYSFINKIYCNGLLVSTGHARFNHRLLRSLDQLQEPTVSVFDREGDFPLKITRDGLQSDLPFLCELRQDVLIDHCAWLVFEAGLLPEHQSPMVAPMWKYNDFFRGQGDGSLEGSVYAITDSGLVPLHGWHLWAARAERLTVEFNFGHQDREIHDAVVSHKLPSPFARSKLRPFGGFGEPPDVPALLELTSFTRNLGWAAIAWSCVIPEQYWFSNSSHSIFLHRTGLADSSYTRTARGLIVYSEAPIEDTEEMLRTMNHLSSSTPDRDTQRGIVRFYFDRKKPPPVDDFAKTWQQLMLPPVIPYDTKKRVIKCKNSLPLLRGYLERYATIIGEERGIDVPRWWR